jgi:hypothetical protein
MAEEGVLVKPKCRHCGFQVVNDTVVGASCPNCNRRFLPEPVIAAGPGAEGKGRRKEGGGDASS